MNPLTVTGYICPRCDDLHDFYEDAVECCQESPPEVTRYECAECETLHAGREDAEACCSALRDDLLDVPEFLRRLPPLQLELYGQLRLL